MRLGCNFGQLLEWKVNIIMNITVIGTGFVGVVSAAVYASLGHQVIGLDVDEAKVSSLKQSKVPFYEPNLEELLNSQQATGRLKFTTDYAQAINSAEIIMIAVGTPSAPDGQADLKYVFMATESLAPHLKPNAIVVVKSTVPPGTLKKVSEIIKNKTDQPFFTASVPEFLREGSAVYDTLHPNRIVIGATEPEVFDKLEALHQGLQAPIVKIKPESAQMAKYAANAYLATRITFINQIADLCEKNGADVEDIINAIGYDQRIGQHYWYPGLGYGGSCFPKDVKELAAYSKSVGESGNLFVKISELNEERLTQLIHKFGDKVGGWQGKTVAFLGLAFKPNTDDLREAPSTKLIPALISAGARVVGFDPMAKPTPSQLGLDNLDQSQYSQVFDIATACQDADIILVAIEWPEIVSFDFSAIKSAKPQTIIDARNRFSPERVAAWGYKYIGIGRVS
jgi:UDPglucose 6-dehydrogenase